MSNVVTQPHLVVSYYQMSVMQNRSLAGIFFISSATLCLEISLTRYFSITQQYHFAFLVVSIAFMGYGASGSFLSFLKIRDSIDRERFLSSSSLLFSLTILASFFLCNLLPFDFIKLSWDKGQIPLIFLYTFLLSIPFFFAGLTISFAISSASSLVNKIYFADLLGAGTGTLLVLVVFLPRGDRGVILLISFLALFSSLLFSPRRSTRFKFILAILMAGEIVLFLLAPRWLSFRISPYKALPVALKFPQAKHLLTKWDAVSRVDILESTALRYAPGLSLMYDKTLPPQFGLSIDGSELSAITPLGNRQDSSLEFLSFLPASLAYSYVEHPRTLIIEPKGGLDVLSALYFNAAQIKVIERNPLTLKLLQKELAKPSGNLYLQQNIQCISAHSRSALKQEKGTYDLIVFSLTDVFGASGTGLHGLSENYMFTVESFAHILDRLSSDGLISMTLYLLPPPRQEIKLLATWIEAMERNGLDPAFHTVAIRSWGTISFFVKKSPITPQEIKKLKDFSAKCLFDLVYYPGIQAKEVNLHNILDNPLYSNLALQLLSPPEREELYRNYLFQIKPATDNRPFFFNFFKLAKLKATYRVLGQKWLPFLQGEFLVLLLLIQSIVIASILILLPLVLYRRRGKRNKGVSGKIFFYFGSIGMAFMFVEIIFIQQFILFLGHPLYSTSIIIFSLLFASGVGSYFSKKILGRDLRRNLRKSLFICAGLVVLYLLLLPSFYEALIHLSLPLKMGLTFLTVFPLGFLMGFPFPTGIRLLAEQEKRLVPWAWATNAFSSVVNSISALMIAFWAGYSLVLVLAAGGYLLALLFTDFSHHGDKSHI